MIIVHTGGTGFFVCSFRATTIVSKSFQSFVLITVNSLFDASTMIFPIMEAIMSASQISRKEIFVAYSVLCGVLTLALGALWLLVESQHKKYEQFGGSASIKSLEEGRNASTTSTDEAPPSSDADKGVRFTNDFKRMPFHRQIRSWPFIFIACFAVIHVFRSNWFLGTL
jgi:hypothetical protein